MPYIAARAQSMNTGWATDQVPVVPHNAGGPTAEARGQGGGKDFKGEATAAGWAVGGAQNRRSEGYGAAAGVQAGGGVQAQLQTRGGAGVAASLQGDGTAGGAAKAAVHHGFVDVAASTRAEFTGDAAVSFRNGQWHASGGLTGTAGLNAATNFLAGNNKGPGLHAGGGAMAGAMVMPHMEIQYGGMSAKIAGGGIVGFAGGAGVDIGRLPNGNVAFGFQAKFAPGAGAATYVRLEANPSTLGKDLLGMAKDGVFGLGPKFASELAKGVATASSRVSSWASRAWDWVKGLVGIKPNQPPPKIEAGLPPVT